MSLTIITPASDYLLTTVTDIKTALEITVSTYDTLLADLVLRASQSITTWCNRAFAKETVKETIPGTAIEHIRLKRIPLVSITSITLDGVAVAASEYEILDASTGILLNESTWTHTRYASGEQKQDWAITYIGGYILPNHTGSPNLPGDIEQACIETVKTWFQGRCRDGTIRSEDVMDLTKLTYTGQAIPLNARQLLESWREYNL